MRENGKEKIKDGSKKMTLDRGNLDTCTRRRDYLEATELCDKCLKEARIRRKVEKGHTLRVGFVIGLP